MRNIAIYWLKRDFRLADNPALWEALQQEGTIVPIFILEPSFLTAPDTANFHIHAITDALEGLRNQLRPYQKNIAIIEGEVVEILQKLYEKLPFQSLYSHEEIGVDRTYKRDIAVGEWCEQQSVVWTEKIQTGVFRRLSSRDKRSKLWKEFTFAPLLEKPSSDLIQKLEIPKEWEQLCKNGNQKLAIEDCEYSLNSEQQKYIQNVSEQAAEATLDDFLYRRGIDYRGGISSPLSAFTAGSRMSVHLAWGTMTGRKIYQKTKERIEILKESDDPKDKKFRSSLSSFLSRLHWRDHFIQRLETAPQMEFEALHPAYENLIYEDDVDFFKAWETGYTGYPMVDACIRCLRATGFVNFRMRAMLTSFACHSLHLNWKLINYPMAKFYTDYEPGIHISQLQMQASVVGINTIRIYSPTKQIIDQDPETVFIKQWIPELRDYTPKEIIEHADTPLSGYPVPIVDWRESSKIMRNRLWEIKKLPETKEQASKVYEKHGSRKGPSTRRKKSSPKKKETI